MLSHKEEIKGFFGPLLNTGTYEMKMIKMDSGTQIDRYTFIEYDSVGYLIKTDHNVLKNLVIFSYSEVECAKHLGRTECRNIVITIKEKILCIQKL